MSTRKKTLNMTSNQFQLLSDMAAENGIEIVIARSENDASKIGIHRLYPDQNDLLDALDVADRDGFITIYCHNDATWPSKGKR